MFIRTGQGAVCQKNVPAAVSVTLTVVGRRAAVYTPSYDVDMHFLRLLSYYY